MLTLLSVFAATIALQAASPAGAPGAELDAKRQQFFDFLEKNSPQENGDDPTAREKLEAWDKAVDEFKTTLMAGIDPTSLPLNEMIGYRDLFPQAQSAAIDARIDKAAQEASPDSIDAMLAQQQAMGRGKSAAREELNSRMLTSPYLSAWVEQRGVLGFVQAFGRTPPELLKPHKDIILALADKFVPTVEGSMGVAVYMKMVVGLGDAITEEQREAMRLRLVEVAQQALAASQSANDAVAITRLERAVAALESNASKGKLMNYEAPDLEFIWAADANGPVAIKSLDELKGKVVVLDFWATWCGPCVGTFPNVRELRAHYSPEDVVVLGVTSLQGHHYPKGKPVVDCTGNPAQEQELMAEYIKDAGITWQVAFSKTDVFNPAYEVGGIPHLAIVDAQGVLRHNGLHPGMPMEQKTKLIDALLIAQGKTPPPLPAAHAPTAPADSATK